MSSCSNHEWELRRVPCTNCKFFSPGKISCNECNGRGNRVNMENPKGHSQYYMCLKCMGSGKLKCESCQGSVWENRYYCKKCDCDKLHFESNQSFTWIYNKIKNCLCGNKSLLVYFILKFYILI